VSHYGVLWMLQRDQRRRIAIVSYGADIARQFSYAVRNDIATFDGTEDNLDLGMRLRSNTRSAGRWGLEWQRGGVIAIGIGGGLAGRPVNVLVIDDPVKDYRAADSLLQSEAAWQWWMSVARPRLAPGAPVILVATRWHERDLPGRLLAKQREDEESGIENYDRWQVINIPAEADHDPNKGETDVLGREPGEFMQSARGRTTAQWETTKQATAPRIWVSLYQGRPTSATGDVFQDSWWRRYSVRPWRQEGDRYFVDCLEMIQSWDMAFKSKDDSDYVVGQVWARMTPATVYLVDQVRGRLSFTETIAAFKRLIAKWPQATAKLVEDKANGPAVIDCLKEEITCIIEYEPKGSKYARAVAVTPFIQAGNVHLPTSEVALFDVEAFLAEAKAFDNGAHDDQVDAMSQALDRLLLVAMGEIQTPEGRVPSTRPRSVTDRDAEGLPPHLRRIHEAARRR